MSITLETLGVTLACRSDAPIVIEAQSFANLVLALHLHRENLGKSNQVLQKENQDDANERLASVQHALVGMNFALGETLAELLRIGRAQGLEFATLGETPVQ